MTHKLIDFGNEPPTSGRAILIRSIIVNGEHLTAGSEVSLSAAIVSKMILGEDYDFPPAVR